jgi:hypothetical protein
VVNGGALEVSLGDSGRRLGNLPKQLALKMNASFLYKYQLSFMFRVRSVCQSERFHSLLEVLVVVLTKPSSVLKA